MAKVVKIIRWQCKYCGAKVSKPSTSQPLKTQCPKRPKGQTHVWVRIS